MPEAFKAKAGLAMHAADDGAVVFDPGTGSFFGLNPPAAAAWTVLANGGGVEDAVEAVLVDFNVDQETAAADVSALIAGLQQRGLLAEQS